MPPPAILGEAADVEEQGDVSMGPYPNPNPNPNPNPKPNSKPNPNPNHNPDPNPNHNPNQVSMEEENALLKAIDDAKQVAEQTPAEEEE